MASTLTETHSETKNLTLEIITRDYNYLMSYFSLHYLNKRALIIQITNYKHALILNKIYNSNCMCNGLITFFLNQQLSTRQKSITYINNSKFKIGNNLIANRLTILDGKIKLEWLNRPYHSYTIICKKIKSWNNYTDLYCKQMWYYRGTIEPKQNVLTLYRFSFCSILYVICVY